MGINDIREIAGIVKTKDANHIRVFRFGVKEDVHPILLSELALENKGVTEYVAPKENLEVKVSQFYDKSFGEGKIMAGEHAAKEAGLSQSMQKEKKRKLRRA